uniref:HAD family hydrolase n=1 Tax=Catenibacterium faecis TaxID=2764323 RepID=UPI003F81639B
MLERIARFYHIDLKDTIAFGNGENDLPMLIKAGTGVAMGNALEHVKEQSDAVCDDCDRDGIGKYLEELLL